MNKNRLPPPPALWDSWVLPWVSKIKFKRRFDGALSSMARLASYLEVWEYMSVAFCENRPFVKIFLHLREMSIAKFKSVFGDQWNVKWSHLAWSSMQYQTIIDLLYMYELWWLKSTVVQTDDAGWMWLHPCFDSLQLENSWRPSKVLATKSKIVLTYS